PADPDKKRKYNAFLDQLSDGEFDTLSEQALRNIAKDFKLMNGGPPREAENVTPEQVSALAARVADDHAPCTHFALWGPFGRQQKKVLKFTAQIFVNGELVTRQLSGPPPFETWGACWRVFRTGMLMLKACLLMLKACQPGPLDGYEEGIRLLAHTFPQHWVVVRRADDTMRAERWERIRQDIEAKVEARKYSEPFDPERPWEAVVREAAYGENSKRSGWWYENVDKPRLTKPPSRAELRVLAAPPAASGAASAGAGGRPAQGNDRPAKKARAQAPKGLAALDRRKDGRFLRDSDEKELCFAWDRSSRGCGEPCKSKPPRVHLCEWCLGPRRAVDE
ncbi:unnamed protein product, partial [Prorocentrum cordatum]